MKVTEPPAQMVVVVAAILTEGVTDGLTVIVIAFDVAVAGEAQLALDVKTQVTTWPLVSVVVVNVGLLVPTFVVPTFH